MTDNLSFGRILSLLWFIMWILQTFGGIPRVFDLIFKIYNLQVYSSRIEKICRNIEELRSCEKYDTPLKIADNSRSLNLAWDYFHFFLVMKN